MYQLSSYRFKGVLSWLKASHYDYLLRYFAYAFFASGFTVLFNLCFPQENIHYFSYLKIEEAKQMIRQEQANFTESSDALGYTSIHYFSRQFKTFTGMSPSEYALSIKALSEEDTANALH